MEYEEAKRRLLYHANLREPDAARWLSLVDTLNASEGMDRVPDVGQHTEDLINCLEAVNLQWSGAKSSILFRKGQAVDEQMSLAVAAIQADVSEFLALGLKRWQQSTDDLCCLAEDLWCIAAAWEAVLAGDVVSVRGHLEEEAKVLGINEMSRWRSAARRNRGVEGG